MALTMKTMKRRNWMKWLWCAALALHTSTLSLAASPPPIPGGFTLVVVPDTQLYALKYPETYDSQTQWIADNARRYNSSFALHVGDITDKTRPPEWQVAAKAHARMAGIVPCAVVPGNHDLGQKRGASFTEHFPTTSFKGLPTFGGFYDREPERSDNSYHLFEAGGRRWLILALEFGPRDDVLRWANVVVARHPDRSVILLTHAYLRPDNTRFDHRAKIVVKGKDSDKGLGKSALPFAQDPAGFNDGEAMWQKLVSQHVNFAFVVCGHTCITGHRTDPGKHGNPVHQILVDYQNQPNGGNGFLRLLQFTADLKTVRVSDYSPTLDQMSDVKGASFELAAPPPPRVAP